ncbi:MAG: outer membrane protein assembly factor BamD [Candidatus Endobugula sp.]|jgi:outer membrane protein assembly factor BamD
MISPMIFTSHLKLYSILSRCTLTLGLLMSLLLIGCSAKGIKKIDFSSKSSESTLYQQAQKDLERGNFADAIELLQTMEKKHPFGEYSKSAQLSLIYAHHGFGEPESASAAANRFIRLHPQHRHVDYAFYMKGLIVFPNAKTFFQRALDVDLSKRDINEARIAFNYFSTLSKRFPDSEYTPDALKRMEFLRNLLARHEIHVANYYFQRKAYLAATNRGRYVVENFQRAPAIPDALAVMAQGYHEMKMHDLAADSIDALRTNYPDYPALNKDGSFNFSYNTRKINTWVDTITLGLLPSSKPPGFDNESLYNNAIK